MNDLEYYSIFIILIIIYTGVVETGFDRQQPPDAISEFSGLQYEEDGQGTIGYYNLEKNGATGFEFALPIILILFQVTWCIVWLQRIWHELLMKLVESGSSNFKYFTLGIITVQQFKEKYMNGDQAEENQISESEVENQTRRSLTNHSDEVESDSVSEGVILPEARQEAGPSEKKKKNRRQQIISDYDYNLPEQKLADILVDDDMLLPSAIDENYKEIIGSQKKSKVQPLGERSSAGLGLQNLSSSDGTKKYAAGMGGTEMVDFSMSSSLKSSEKLKKAIQTRKMKPPREDSFASSDLSSDEQSPKKKPAKPAGKSSTAYQVNQMNVPDDHDDVDLEAQSNFTWAEGTERKGNTGRNADKPITKFESRQPSSQLKKKAEARRPIQDESEEEESKAEGPGPLGSDHVSFEFDD